MLLDGPSANRGPEVADDLDIPLNRSEIHQAQGMVMVALGITLADAMIRMRARAFTDDVPLVELARGVISGVVHPKDWGVGHD
jgi:AmiR/NasT family two-component response regulator